MYVIITEGKKKGKKNNHRIVFSYLTIGAYDVNPYLSNSKKN